MSSRTTLAVDVGGTFTDAVLASPAGVFTAKTPTTPDDQSIGVIAAAEAALGSAALGAAEVDGFIHGMTVTTNALLESKLAKTALLTTAGFTDLEELGRQNRADLYHLAARRPAPIVPRELRFGVDERCGPGGVLRALDREAVEAQIRAALAAGAQALAVCLLFSFRYPDHELQIREIAARVAPELHVSLSHEVVGTFREYERLSTTVIDAALCPLLTGYLKQLAMRSAERGLPEPLVMLSNGGAAPLAFAAANAASTVLSGPAGGAVAAAAAAARSGATRALAIDMGGTSTDIALISNGEVALAPERTIAGRPIALPALDINTVGAGGGSIAWRDAGGALRVGPQSAGARPGPVAYGHGGELPTVTDANLLLGYLAPSAKLAGGLALDLGAAEVAIGRLAASLELTPIETAAGIVEVANLEMLRATGAATLARGIDPRSHTLIAFGGAGPMHAAAIAEALEITRVVCPSACGVLSALGMSVSVLRGDRSRSLVQPLETVTSEQLGILEDELAAALASELGLADETAVRSATYELRYAGQAFELAVEGPFQLLAENFHAAHEERFGFRRDGDAIELVTVRVAVEDARQPSTPAALPAAAPARSQRAAWFAGEQLECAVLTGQPQLGASEHGPALIELAEATIVVPPGWSARAIGDDILLERAT